MVGLFQQEGRNMQTQVEYPRTFLAPDAQFSDWNAVERYYQELLDRPVSSAAEFERWLLDFSELDAAFDEEGTARRVAKDCQTDDPEREQRFLYYITEIYPNREPIHDELRKKLVALADRFPLPKARYEVLLRSVRNTIELYREENVPLMVEDQKLGATYQKIVGAMTVTYDGREQTLPQMAKYQEEPDRKVREKTWRLITERFLNDAAELNDLYDKMVVIRTRIAKNAGLADYREYAFREKERFDYTPDDCLAFHDAIQKVVVPAVSKLLAERKRRLQLDALRPWDLSVDPESRAPLRPFETDEQLAEGASRIFHRVNRDLGAQFDLLRERGVLDLGTRKGKAPGGYQAMFYERRMPFIFMNAAGTESDVRTLLHEGGHAFHAWACRNEPLLPYRHYPMEFAEVASMGMEGLCLPHIDEFYGKDANRARKRYFEELVMFFPWMAQVDAFQHYVYTQAGVGDELPDNKTRIERRNDEWVRIVERFSPDIDRSGLEVAARHSWHRKLHFFEVPFYYVEYGIAQLGALQVWKNSRADYEQAVNFYRHALALGGSRPLPELFEAAGAKFDFTEKTLRPLIEAVMEEIGRL
jgi:oligoendopeptidase F